MALFNEHETILYMSTNLMEKEDIENGLNREMEVVSTVKTFVDKVHESSTRFKRVNLVFTKDIPKEIRAHFEMIVSAVEVLIKNEELDVMVVTIGLSDVFSEALTFGNIRTFVEYARRHDRNEKIAELEQSDDEEEREEARILKQLTIELEATEEREADYREKYKLAEELAEDLQAEIDKLQLEIDTVYKVELDNSEVGVRRYEEKIKELDRKLTIEKEKMKDYEAEVNELRNVNKGYELEIASLTDYNRDQQDEKELLNRQIKALEEELDKESKLKAELYNSRVESEKALLLTEQLENERNEKLLLEQESEKIRIENKKQGYIIEDLRNEIALIKRGDVDLSQRGMTLRLDTHNFGTMNVFYFKVIHELPYLCSYLEIFQEKIEETFLGRTAKIIMKNDEGIDDEIFDGVEVYGHIGDIPSETKKCILYPTQRMFNGAEDFERYFTNIIVVDYIQSPNYYISTRGTNRVYTVVKDSALIRQYGLQGEPISLDPSSLLEIRYDPRFSKAVKSSARRKMMEKKVERLLTSSGIKYN